jgi:hypothetical protein
MADILFETTYAEAKLVLDQTDSPLEIFNIPESRVIDGKAFPLGVAPTFNDTLTNVDDVVKHIKTLADQGVFDALLSSRKGFLD